ncbi:hypothetical protein CPC08DRAFT_762946 [Agrocybe pediades]|nr:hypothetical protein CPC08DRAFT_762946 [Agrocybe pediades]
MSTTSNFPFSISRQKAFISADLNATLVFQFLFGIYTGVFLATLYIYLRLKINRTTSQGKIVIGSISALYGITALNVPLNWYYTNVVFCSDGGSRIEMFVEVATFALPKGVIIVITLTQYGFLFAGALLAWRCYYACGRSLLKSLPPIGLLVVQTGLMIASTIYTYLLKLKPGFANPARDRRADKLNSAMFVTIAATSVVATFIICWHIYEHTTPGTFSRKRYQNVINALIQSSAMYSVIVVVQAVLGLLDTGEIQAPLTFVTALIGQYMSALSQISAGLAPTLMVAWLALSSARQDVEVSSASLPSDLVSHSFSLAGANGNSSNQEDIEWSPRTLASGIGEDQTGESNAVTSTSHHR